MDYSGGSVCTGFRPVAVTSPGPFTPRPSTSPSRPSSRDSSRVSHLPYSPVLMPFLRHSYLGSCRCRPPFICLPLFHMSIFRFTNLPPLAIQTSSEVWPCCRQRYRLCSPHLITFIPRFRYKSFIAWLQKRYISHTCFVCRQTVPDPCPCP